MSYQRKHFFIDERGKEREKPTFTQAQALGLANRLTLLTSRRWVPMTCQSPCKGYHLRMLKRKNECREQDDCTNRAGMI